MSVHAYITATGAFLPGPPIDNDEMEAVLGLVHGERSRLKARILKANGITSRSAPISPLGNLPGLPFRDPSKIPAGSAGEALFG